MNKRIEYLDIAKARGIILVMISHSCGMPFNTTMYFANFYIQLFWIISGLTYEDNKDIYKNVKKKFTKLIIPYFIYSGIIFILGIFFQNIKTTREMLLERCS